MSTRRQFLATAATLWSAAVARAQQHHRVLAATSRSASYDFLFFTTAERDILRLLLDRIVPADDRSTGALGAYADEYIDFILFHADAATQQTWRRGLASYARAVPSPSPETIDAFLQTQATHEFQPRTDDQTFFVLLKAATVEAFYTSREGIERELGYQGMNYSLAWEGCTHAHHNQPENWRPLLQSAQTT